MALTQVVPFKNAPLGHLVQTNNPASFTPWQVKHDGSHFLHSVPIKWSFKKHAVQVAGVDGSQALQFEANGHIVETAGLTPGTR